MIEDILNLNVKPKEKQNRLVQAVLFGEIPVGDFIAFFESAGKVDKGTCADAMKHIASAKPGLLLPHIDILMRHINDSLPRVKWGIPEAIGNMSKEYPQETAQAIPFLLKNTTMEKNNTTVIRWCAAFALTEIARHNQDTRQELLPVFKTLASQDENSGVRRVYIKAVKEIIKQLER